MKKLIFFIIKSVTLVLALSFIVTIFIAIKQYREGKEILSELQAKNWKIYFTSDGNLYQFQLDGTRVARLPENKFTFTNPEHILYFAAVSPSGEEIALLHDVSYSVPYNARVVTIIDFSGRKIADLSLGSADRYAYLSWSPKGKKILIGDPGEPASMKIWDLDSGEVSVINSGISTSFTSGFTPPSWAPDGSHFYYEDRDGYIKKLNIHTLQKETIVKGYYLSLSPDGKKLIYKSGDIYYLRDLGEAIDRELFKGRWKVRDPLVWSPDGKYLLIPINTGSGWGDVSHNKMELYNLERGTSVNISSKRLSTHGLMWLAQ